LKIKTEINAIRDLTGKKVFRGVGVDTLIYNITRLSPKKGSAISYNEPASIEEMDKDTYDCLQETLDDNSWMFLRKESIEIKEYIDLIGTLLDKMNVNINFGIKTGLNDAFIVERDKREKLIKTDKKNDNILKPILRGRDITQYKISWHNLWLAYIPWHFPLDSINIQGVSEEAENEFKNRYRSMYDHLVQYKNDLSGRNQDETGIRYEWYALQRFGSTYYKDFNLPKIVNRDMSPYPCFCFDQHGFYGNTGMYMITPKKLMNREDMLLIALLLNSSTVFFHFKQFASKLGEKGYRFWRESIGKIPIVMPKKHPALFTRLSEIIHYIVARDLPHVPFLKDIANAIVQDLYFHAKFHADGIYPEDKEWLAELLEPCVEPITFKEWDDLDWNRQKGEITAKETKELDHIIKENDAAIEKVVKEIQGNAEIHRVAGLIKQHPWVQIIDKDTAVKAATSEDEPSIGNDDDE
jgi:hypothetical protein